MDLNKYTDRLGADMRAAAGLGDDKTRETATALADATSPALKLVLLSALTEFAGAVSESLGDREISVRLDGEEVVLDVRKTPDVTQEDHDRPGDARRDATDAWTAFDDLSGDVSRVTLRLVEQIKERAEEAATQNGVSLNSWVSQAVQGALRDQMRRNGTDKF
ncbi:toxin-antitoxin system HicB family antitoxin [Rhodococcus sp. NPDC058521]|uniref:toxin-antitoxin system HicB family antitoxin n=1 Tax=Rhodococcus sp. NPDC058521 TaxID=3346536 RepID=UPI003667717B